MNASTGFPASWHASKPLPTGVQGHTLTVTTHNDNEENRSAKVKGN